LDSAVTTLLRDLAEANGHLRWRAAHSAGRCALGEKPDQKPAESLLQRVWLYQRLRPDRLQTTGGRKVTVLHPGFWNHEPGPDFRHAIIQFENERPVTGDIEIDILPGGWTQHHHAGNPAYRNVVLHVTWEPESAGGGLPNLPLKHALDSTLAELSFWLGLEPKPAPEAIIGKCSAPLRSLSAAAAAEILRQAAQARLLAKAEQLQARARQSGWEGALWEALCAALGYKRNTWPMRRIGELLPILRRDLPQNGASILTLQARLLGSGGLLPSEVPATESGEYLRRVWQVWWREAESLAEYRLPANIWTLGGIRPANHPQRRVATAAHWALRPGFLEQLDQWLERKIESPDLVESLTEILQVNEDEFWSYHWTLKSTRFRKAQPLLGEQRITDLAINVVLPWLYVRALAGRNEALVQSAERRYFLWPAGEDNSILKLARQRLFGGVSARFLQTAAHQQGLIQIVRDFCDHSDAACHHCEFPALVSSSVTRE
jgi:hypothetical protein